MKEILDDIKNGTFHRAYLLYGPEAYLKQQYRNKLLDALVPEGDTMNFARFEGKGLDEGQIIDLAETVPFFEDHRVILLENTGLFKAKADRLADYTAALPDYLVLIFVEEEADKRSRLYKGVQKAGLVTEFGVQKEDDLMRWVLGILKRKKKKITRPDMELFLEKTGSDMGNIHMELQKLLDYTLGREVIAREDIEAVCTTQISNRIFDMIRAMTEKRQKEALKLYYDLLALKEPPMRILYLMARQFHQLLLVKTLAEDGFDQKTIASRAALAPFAVRKILPLTRRYTRQELEEAVENFTRTETEVKTGKLNDALSVELMLVKYSA